MMTHEHPSAPEASCDPLPTGEEPLDWRRAHEELSELAKTRARLDWQEGIALLFALRAGAHVMLGFGTFAEYVERLLGYGPRWTRRSVWSGCESPHRRSAYASVSSTTRTRLSGARSPQSARARAGHGPRG